MLSFGKYFVVVLFPDDDIAVPVVAVGILADMIVSVVVILAAVEIVAAVLLPTLVAVETWSEVGLVAVLLVVVVVAVVVVAVDVVVHFCAVDVVHMYTVVVVL